MKELDLLLQAWLEGPYRSATPAERARFTAFLDLPDPEMAACLLAQAAPADPDFAPLVAQLARSRPGGRGTYVQPAQVWNRTARGDSKPD